jgi:hypothetical protein
MPSGIKIYKINDFIRLNESGNMDLDRTIQIVKEVAAAASSYSDHNILIDLRETTLLFYGMEEVIKIVMTFVQLMPPFKNKIASLIPNDENRVSFEKNLKACFDLQDFDFMYFTDYEDAIEWLSDVKT